MVLTAVAHKAVESTMVVKKVIKGECTVTDALVHIKDTAIATFKGLWDQYGGKIKDEIADKVGILFGPVGAMTTGGLLGFLTPQKDESRLKSTVKGFIKAGVNFLTKPIQIPFFNKVKTFLTEII
jgi:hypothetical protein